MTRARAPGKLVLSGAYSVLHGAPAIVTATGRHVTADTERPSLHLAAEVAAALAPGQSAPFIDASELREDGRKLGLGSSSAILLASLFALERQQDERASDDELRQRLFARALAAHRAAQGGGSGVDVAASCFGGTLVYELAQPAPRLRPVTLPAVTLEVWICPSSASTRELLASVDALAQRTPEVHQVLLSTQARAARQAVDAVDGADAPGFIGALAAQARALLALGHAAGVPIVTPELAALAGQAEAEGGALLPAGAGGGDIAIFFGRGASTAALRQGLERARHRQLELELSVPGVRAA